MVHTSLHSSSERMETRTGRKCGSACASLVWQRLATRPFDQAERLATFFAKRLFKRAAAFL